MFSRTVEIDLTDSECIEKAINELLRIDEEIKAKTIELANKLADLGITVAQSNAGDEFKPYIEFSKKVENEGEGECTVVMYGKNIEDMISQWKLKDGTVRTVKVNALLMNEVGSGQHVYNPDNLEGGFPGALNTYGHALDRNGWYWVDMSGVKHHSTGREYHLSMHTAYMEMNKQVYDVVREVFG